MLRGMLRKLLLWPLLALSFSGYAAGFSLQDMQGKTQRLEDYRGKWVLVNFWATWCPPCLSEIPELISLHNAHKDSDLVVIGIAMDSGSNRKIAYFSQAHGISYPQVNWQYRKSKKLDQEIFRNFGDIEAVPSNFLYSPKGELVSRQLGGEVTRASVEAYIKSKKF